MKQIAMVEDHPDNRLLVQMLLQDLYEVAAYETGAEALVGLRQHKPDLVLLDISLPDMDGAELLRQLRVDATLHDLPVVALTAHAMSGDRERFLALGFDDYVAKPIEEETALLHAIERALARRSGASDPPR
jgi:two-component system, cell cycle response regulator DivK